jgi:hypothetical protein
MFWSAHTLVYYLWYSLFGDGTSTCLMGGLLMANDVYSGFVYTNQRPKINILLMLQSHTLVQYRYYLFSGASSTILLGKGAVCQKCLC